MSGKMVMRMSMGLPYITLQTSGAWGMTMEKRLSNWSWYGLFIWNPPWQPRWASFALEQVLRGGETVLDVGTGSGVLHRRLTLGGQGHLRLWIRFRWLCGAGKYWAQSRYGKHSCGARWLSEVCRNQGGCHSCQELMISLIHLTEDAYRLVVRRNTPSDSEWDPFLRSGKWKMSQSVAADFPNQ